MSSKDIRLLSEGPCRKSTVLIWERAGRGVTIDCPRINIFIVLRSKSFEDGFPIAPVEVTVTTINIEI